MLKAEDHLVIDKKQKPVGFQLDKSLRAWFMGSPSFPLPFFDDGIPKLLFICS